MTDSSEQLTPEEAAAVRLEFDRARTLVDAMLRAAVAQGVSSLSLGAVAIAAVADLDGTAAAHDPGSRSMILQGRGQAYALQFGRAFAAEEARLANPGGQPLSTLPARGRA